jgi:hypothetical protein
MRRGLLAAVLLVAACTGGVTDAPYISSGAPGAGGPASDGGNGAPGTMGPPLDCSQVTLAPRRIWRLTPTQYDNTLHDLLGIDSSYGAGFPADDEGVGFANAADGLLMTPLLADKIGAAAEEVSGKVDLSRYLSCDAMHATDTCLRDFVTKLGERAFRRPLTNAESDRYFNLAKSMGDFDAGTRLVVNAMLQSPNFLYRFEVGTSDAPGHYALDDYEIATELSYLLWQTMPDDALFAAAKAKQLHDPKQVAQQVDRMLRADRAKPMVRQFVFDWLDLTTIPTVPKDSATYPELTPDIRAAMVDEAQHFVDAVMFGTTPDQNGSLSALLNAPTTYLNDALAKFYGVSLAANGGSELQPVALTDQDRRGILTLGGVLLTHSRSNDSSPIHRGKLVRERLLCQPLPPPPAGLVLQPPGLDPTKTARERYAEHSSNAYCSTCHRLMDPIGFAFEHFDGIGRFRPDDNGLPIDVSGEVIANDPTMYPLADANGTFMGTDGLDDKLEASTAAQSCYALEWFRFAYGEGKTERDAAGYPSCQAKAFEAAVLKTSGSLTDIITTLTQSDWFYARTGPQTPPAPPPAVDVPSAPAGQTPAGGTSMSPMSTGLPAGLELMQTVNNDWNAGYCYTYQVTNTGMSSITWSVPLDVKGTMNQHWECNVSGDSGSVTFTGVDHNATLAPGGSTQFGFCGALDDGTQK